MKKGTLYYIIQLEDGNNEVYAMVKARQMEVRSNIKKYFDMAYEGTPIIVPRKENKNVVIISESEYSRLGRIERIFAYAEKLKGIKDDTLIPDKADIDIRTENLDKLFAISTLEDNWNGNGAPSFPRKLIEKVHGIITDLAIQPELFPTALQTIQLEYDNSRKDHMEIEIGTDDMSEVFVVGNSGGESIERIESTARAINERVGAFYG